ncbi:hypothetical protein GGP41_003002 [Bipolaris sorokiniana]|uniref:Uncharacterized protein n=2 Tax=Cochliobolus sativus TaxID=45130 RepID=A0A8H6DT49_COCSA|nr:uncharacterized protein COCSADRAFT_313868 [Bipolaris sorokiniana ND90Pr]EMD64719.1 hypothetical protein COCSADRAFT_313868 [Bipolaris sorokiniana ND90Pr]KAF5845415.1 hypothetical protein GGP41_003002 [Bipolaris sorokiniana]
MGYWREFTFHKSPVGWLTPSVDPRHTPAPKFPLAAEPGIKANRARSSIEQQQQQRVVAIDFAVLMLTGRVLHGQVVFSCRRRPDMSSAQTQAQTLTRKPMYVTDSRTYCLLCLVSTAQRSAAQRSTNRLGHVETEARQVFVKFRVPCLLFPAARHGLPHEQNLGRHR